MFPFPSGLIHESSRDLLGVFVGGEVREDGGMDPEVFLFIYLLLRKTLSWVPGVN
jgi:hypothetical protein